MENPLASMPPEQEQASMVQPPQKTENKPEAPKQSAPEKKPFFTKGKIIAIFIGLVVIAAIVGAVLYYQSSEQFQGATFRIAPIAPQQAEIAPIVTQTRPLEVVTTTTESQQIPDINDLPCDASLGLAAVTGRSYNCACTADERSPNPEIWDPVDNGWAIRSMEDYQLYETKPCVCPDDKPIWSSEQQKCIVLEFVTGLQAEFVPVTVEEETPLITTIRPEPLEVFIPQEEEETCENTSALNDLVTAYNSNNWDAYQGALQTLDDLNCIDDCKSDIYWIISHIYTNNLDQARAKLAEFKKNCGTNCNLYFNLLAVVAEVMSDIDQRSQTLTAQVQGLTDDHLDFLRQVAEGYINSCQCLELEQLLANPIQALDNYFPENLSSAAQLNTVNITPMSGTTLNLSSGLTVAYAQSYSPTVLSILQSVVDTNCVPEEEPQICEGLEIQAPFNVTLYAMDELFDPATDELEITISGSDKNIQNYRYRSSNSTIEFDETSSSYTTPNKIVTLSGGPAVGSTETITVTAIDVSGAEIQGCSDAIRIVRADADEPLCRELRIIEPAAANASGTPEFEISEAFSNETLKVEIEGDNGSWDDLRYTSDNGNITFNGQSVLDTTSLSVEMNGAPPEGAEELVTVWARRTDEDGNLSGIKACHDAFVVKLAEEEDDDGPPTLTYTPPDEEEPPDDEDEPPTLTYTPPDEEDEPPVITYVPPTEDEPPVTIVTSTPSEPTPIYVTQTQPETTIVTTTAPALHAAAPATPQTGPGIIIPLIGTALGGAWLRRRKK